MTQQKAVSIAHVAPLVGEPADDEITMQINLRLRLDEVAEAEASELRSRSSRLPTTRELCRLACRIYENRRARDRIIDRKLFGEPAWDMLLALYCLPSRGEILSATSLSHAANVALTTGHRWQTTLIEEGLIERGPKGIDARRQSMRLSKLGRNLMDRYLTHLFYCDTPVPEKVGVEQT